MYTKACFITHRRRRCQGVCLVLQLELRCRRGERCRLLPEDGAVSCALADAVDVVLALKGVAVGVVVALNGAA